MTNVFQTVLNMSITGAYIAAAIIILRFCMKKLPRKYSYMLWSMLGIRLLCPVSFSSAISLFNIFKPEITGGEMTYIPRDIVYMNVPAVNVDVPVINDAVNSALSSAEAAASVNPVQILLFTASVIWLAGIAAMLAYSVLSYLAVKRRVRSATVFKENVYLCGSIETPFVYGIIKPKIYIPSGVSESDLDYILAHERAHIKRGDHIVKLLALAALTVHWFNPLAWISFRLMTNDMELSCDERALKSFGGDVKKDYASALLNISVKQNNLSYGGLLSFGESNTKSRIKSVLSSKKPTVIVTAVAVAALIVAAVCLLTNAKTSQNPEESLLASLSFSNELYSLNRAGEEREFTQAELQPLLDKLAATGDRRVDGEKLVYPDGGNNLTITMYPKKDNRADYITLDFISAIDENGKAIYCVALLNANSYHVYEISESDWFEISDIFNACFDKNSDGAQTTQPTTQLTAQPALSLLNCSIDKDGAYYADQTAWSASNDYALFREYFFGTWEGSFCFPEGPERESLIIDDSEKSFVMTETEIKVLDSFYETGAGALAFMIGNYCGSAILWINFNEPDTMYIAWGGSTSPLWSRNENGEYSTDPIIYSLRKTDVPLNKPEDNFLSIFKLREIALEYGIDPMLLSNIEYEIDGTVLYHDDWYQFYPMYLVSKTPEKLTLKTTVGNVYYLAVQGDVTYTIEKIGGEWVRTTEFGFTAERMSCLIAADNVTAAYLQNNKEALTKYLAEPGDEILPEGTEYVYDRLSSMSIQLPDLSAIATDAFHIADVRYTLTGDDLPYYLHIGLKMTDGGWKIGYLETGASAGEATPSINP